MHSLGNYREALEKSRSLPLNQVLLESCSDCRMYLTPIPQSQRGGLSAITIRACHVREAFSHCYCKEKPTGWVISRDDFFTAASAIPLRWSRNQGRPVPVSPAITSVLPDFILLSILGRLFPSWSGCAGQAVPLYGAKPSRSGRGCVPVPHCQLLGNR